MLGPCTRLERFSALQGKLLQSNSTPKSLLREKRPTISLQTVQWRPSWDNCLSFSDIVQHRTLPRVPFYTSQQISACRACWRGSSSWRGCDIDFGRVGVRAVIVSNQASKYLYLSLVAATLDGAPCSELLIWSCRVGGRAIDCAQMIVAELLCLRSCAVLKMEHIYGA